MLADAAAARDAAMPVGEMVGEFGRWLLITVVLAASMPRVGVNTMQTAVMFGLVMWVSRSVISPSCPIGTNASPR